MMALLIKDWRLNRPVTIAWLVVYITLPLAMLLVVYFDQQYPGLDRTAEYVEAAITGVLAALGTASIIVPAFGAITFARERRDRSADFLASLPIQRLHVVASKTIVTLALCALPWIGAFAMFAVAHAIWPRLAGPFCPPGIGEDHGETIRVFAHLQVVLLGVSWLLSSFLRSEVLAASVTILATTILCVVWGVYVDRMYQHGPEFHELAVRIGWNGSLALGIIGFIAGIVITLRRVSP